LRANSSGWSTPSQKRIIGDEEIEAELARQCCGCRWPAVRSWSRPRIRGRERPRSPAIGSEWPDEAEIVEEVAVRACSSGVHIIRPLALFPEPLPQRPGVAILLDMSSAEHMSLADVKNHLSEVVERLEREHGRVVLTKHGRPAVVLLSVEDLESLEETLDILSNQTLMDQIRTGDHDIETGAVERLSRDEVLARRSQA